jgi:hypothetical protein
MAPFSGLPHTTSSTGGADSYLLALIHPLFCTSLANPKSKIANRQSKIKNYQGL